MEHTPNLFVGIMSGTSCDGIDVAIVDPSAPHPLVYFEEHAMPDELRRQLLELAERGSCTLEMLGTLDRALGIAYASAVQATLARAEIAHERIAAIGCHGQTIRHDPCASPPFTLQIGCPATLAEQTGITVVDDFRRRDMAAGGQGAPLAPFAHRQLFAHPKRITVVLNIGGIANLTWLEPEGATMGFDCGPGNMIMDGLMQHFSKGARRFDLDGRLAAQGRVCEPLLNDLLTHPFIRQRPPKSTGREDFGKAMVHRLLNWPHLSDADRMATACAFTVRCIALQRRWLPADADRWLICGGGARNRHLMRSLQQALAPAIVHSTNHVGVPPQAVEAVCFAILAQHCLLGRVNTLASVTGAQHDSCGGRITPGANWPRLLRMGSGAWTH
ncbi:MAG: anhydro-N-acetylmuramic acid kinase [Zetaproteobacteria bacterium]|nr:MAG: anhydro-N-acetylmuramic acid kinase [Zetaproteobacteria bacterium]